MGLSATGGRGSNDEGAGTEPDRGSPHQGENYGGQGQRQGQVNQVGQGREEGGDSGGGGGGVRGGG